MTLVNVSNPLSKTLDGMMKEFFNDFPATLNKTVREDVLHFPPVNILEQENQYSVELAAPGFEKADFKIKLEKNLLSISAETKESTQEKTDKMIRKELSRKAFTRSFTVDEKIDVEQIQASYANGILKLELPKKIAETQSAKEINIQ